MNSIKNQTNLEEEIIKRPRNNNSNNSRLKKRITKMSSINLFNYEVKYNNKEKRKGSEKINNIIILTSRGYMPLKNPNRNLYKMKKITNNNTTNNNFVNVNTILRNNNLNKIYNKNEIRKKVIFSKETLKIRNSDTNNLPSILSNIEGVINLENENLNLNEIFKILYQDIYLHSESKLNIKNMNNKFKNKNNVKNKLWDSFSKLLDVNIKKMQDYHNLKINEQKYMREDNKTNYYINQFPGNSQLLSNEWFNNYNKNKREAIDHITSINSFDFHDYIFRINNNTKTICIGDIHGSFHSFFRIILRLLKNNTIDKNLKLTNNTKLIFLGDIMDRGYYSTEVFIIILILMIQNNTDNNLNVILNRGNHELIHIFTLGSNPYYDELKVKFNRNKQIEIYNKIYKLILYLSSGIILKDNNINYWLCHGGFKYDLKEKIGYTPGIILDNRKMLRNVYFENNFFDYCFQRNKINRNYEETKNIIRKIIRYLNLEKNERNLTKKQQTYQKRQHYEKQLIKNGTIQKSDMKTFVPYDLKVDENWEVYDFNIKKNFNNDILWSDFMSYPDYDVFINERTSDRSFFNIAPNLINKFFITNKINFIVRGHQDSLCNNWILTKFVNKNNRKYGTFKINRNFILPLSFLISYSIIKAINETEKIQLELGYNNNNHYDKNLVKQRINIGNHETFNKFKNNIKKVDGSISKIYPDFYDNWYQSYLGHQKNCTLPVLTISTNSDKGRYLYCDSYCEINNN